MIVLKTENCVGMFFVIIYTRTQTNFYNPLFCRMNRNKSGKKGNYKRSSPNQSHSSREEQSSKRPQFSMMDSVY